MSPFSLSDLRVFHGKLTANSAAIYAKFPQSPQWSSGMQLAGEVTGPICEGTRTLPATVPLRFMGVDPTPLAIASMPDPTFWSPAVPARYEVTVRVTDGQTIHLEGIRRLGLRRLGPKNRSLTDQGRRTVVRAVADRSRLEQHGAEDWHEQRLHFLQAINDQTDVIQLAQQLDIADRTGFLLVVSVETCDEANLRQQLRLCSGCAAVSLVVVSQAVISSAEDVLANCAGELPNLRMAAELSIQQAATGPDWSLATVICVDQRKPSDLALSGVEHPIVLRRTAVDIPTELAAKRRLCEQLQRDFTTAGDFAGYLIG